MTFLHRVVSRAMYMAPSYPPRVKPAVPHTLAGKDKGPIDMPALVAYDIRAEAAPLPSDSMDLGTLVLADFPLGFGL